MHLPTIRESGLFYIFTQKMKRQGVRQRLAVCEMRAIHLLRWAPKLSE